MKTIRLSNGMAMPMIGYRVYRIPPSGTKDCVLHALEAGYWLIDTAQCYFNEEAVGEAIRESGIPRDRVFVTTKLWGRDYEDTLDSIQGSLDRLGFDYIDLLLIHKPSGDYLEIYRAMEDEYRKGKLRAIGVSNFLNGPYTRLASYCRIPPMVPGSLSGKYNSASRFQGGDIRRVITRFDQANLEANQPVIELIRSLAERKNATPAQI